MWYQIAHTSIARTEIPDCPGLLSSRLTSRPATCVSVRPAENRASKMARAKANKGSSQLSKLRGPFRKEKEGIECLFFVDHESKIGELRA